MDAESKESVVAWLLEWQGCIQTRDVERARQLFSVQVVAFGTYTNHLQGLEDLIVEQWEPIWKTTDGFRFIIQEGTFYTSSDGSFACAGMPWLSYGYREDGTRFPRAGRCTILLQRAGRGDRWTAVHTHFSLDVEQQGDAGVRR